MRKVSIIVPAYNVEKYITQCIQSLCNQTYKNVEIIIIDDESNDNTYNYALEAAKIDRRIKIYKNKNHGVSYTRNFGLKNCSGEYISFVDADDVVSTDFIEQMVMALEETASDMAAVGVIKRKFFKQGIFTSGKTTVYEKNEILKQVFGIYEGFLCNKLYKKELIQKYNIYLAQDIAVCEDALFNINYLLNCEKVAYNDGKRYFYRQTEHSATYDVKNIKWFSAMESYKRILELLNSNQEVYKEALNQYALFLCNAKYRIKYIDDREIEEKVKSEWIKIRPKWKMLSLQQRIKLYIFKLFPKQVFLYQRRKLNEI